MPNLKKQFKLLVLAVGLMLSASFVNAAEKEAPSPVTIQKPDIPLDVFELQIAPMTSDELFVEADGWLKLLHDAAKEVYAKKLEILAENRVIKSQTEHNASLESQEVENKKKNKLSDELIKLRNDRHDKELKLNAILKEINERIGLDDKG